MQQLKEVVLLTEKAFGLFGPFSAYSQIRSSTFCNQQELVMLIPSWMSPLICKTTVSMIKHCRRKHCSRTAALNLQYLKALCSYRKATPFSHFITTNCKTRDYSMTNESLNSHLLTQVSHCFTRSLPTLCILEHLLSPAPDLPQNRMAAHATQPNLPSRALVTLPCLYW